MFDLIICFLVALGATEGARRLAERSGEEDLPRVARRLTVISSLLAVAGGVLLIGIPGALFLEIGDAGLTALGYQRLDSIGDGAWGMAIIVSLICPFFLPISVVGARFLLPNMSDGLAEVLGILTAISFSILFSVFLLLIA